jgi:hypothetical protein
MSKTRKITTPLEVNVNVSPPKKQKSWKIIVVFSIARA